MLKSTINTPSDVGASTSNYNNKFFHLIKHHEKLPTCQYTYELYYPSEIRFDCNEPIIADSKFCIFHDKDHYSEHMQEAAKRFKEIVSESISQNKPLKCTGYYLPAINFAELLEGKRFEQVVYLPKATFYEGASFSGVAFSKEANFFEAIFSKEADFSDAKFTERADFSAAKFTERADFSEAKFDNVARFSRAKFDNVADFRVATFANEVLFGFATFANKALFRLAIFSKEADFSDVKFSDTADFYGAAFSDRADLSEDKLYEGASFSRTIFSKEADFSKATFSKKADFSAAKFLAEANFPHSRFLDKTFFRHTLFEHPNRVTFEDSDLSKVSFADSDITRVRFDDKITWGEDGFTVIEEVWLKEKAKGKDKKDVYENVSMELVLSIYRNLRENYEFRLRYDDAGKFFIKEMELKRKYRETKTENSTETKENAWFRRHFSLTGLYYHLSRYGESISRPAIIGAITVFLSTLFWVTQSNPTLQPHFDSSLETESTSSTFVGFREIGNPTQWLKGFERSLAGFIPILSLGGETEVGIIDYIIKIFGGGLTFVLLAIALRRKFERKYTR